MTDPYVYRAPDAELSVSRTDANDSVHIQIDGDDRSERVTVLTEHLPDFIDGILLVSGYDGVIPVGRVIAEEDFADEHWCISTDLTARVVKDVRRADGDDEALTPGEARAKAAALLSAADHVDAEPDPDVLARWLSVVQREVSDRADWTPQSLARAIAREAAKERTP